MTKVLEKPINSKISPGNFVPLLDTLAQPGTKLKKSGKNTLKRRAVAKYITNEIVFGLVDTESSLHQSYWNTFHCSHSLKQDGSKITGRYCNNRWCIVCNRIRTAKMVNSYLPSIRSDLAQPFFITLTVPNVPGSILRETVQGMLYNFVRINHLFRHRRTFSLKGIRKIECTYNVDRDDYHPHFHLIIDGSLPGEELINAWLEAYPDATREAQDIRPADEGSMIELFKYTTKLTTKNDITREDGKVEIRTVPMALDTIFQALYKIRTFQPINIRKVPVNEDIEELQSELFKDLSPGVESWTWLQQVSDWISPDGEMLTGCEAHKVYKVRRSAVKPAFRLDYNQFNSDAWADTLKQFEEFNREVWNKSP